MSLLRSTAAWLLAAATGAYSPTPTAQPVTNPYSCRSAHVAAYWFRGVESDACDGPLPEGTFGGEGMTGFGPGEQINHASGRVRSCTVQLNHVVRGQVIPVPGASNTETGRTPEYFDGRFCDAMDSWAPPRGFYNVSVTYCTTTGGAVQTVQGPVAFYPGGSRA
ncbi:hypothetical protein KGQ20_04100 [Catenulispora sp. NF23]|uniref:Secreted protein n=1 Tax=Catenulispora pinistramenti TaxID=2705254 RepID=A0ABS5KIJ8_9ACTN|nr:hypothetical protein [Catenulispora pinistramenti]MBS2531946.1 hypothetical protein [Catenulispora pinistramenti]MBS2546213.1 hypothetical protein [Catenulispora pinistramenti]